MTAREIMRRQVEATRSTAKTGAGQEGEREEIVKLRCHDAFSTGGNMTQCFPAKPQQRVCDVTLQPRTYRVYQQFDSLSLFFCQPNRIHRLRK